MREPSEYITSVDCGALGELDCSIWYFYTPADPGRLSGPPENCYPPEPAEVEVTKVEWPCDNGYLQAQWEHLDEDVRDDIIQSIIEKEEDERAEAMAEAHERARGCDYTDDWP